jgi:hypothetical protein
MADSQFSIQYLSSVYGINLNSKLNETQTGIARCLLKTCEESLRWCMVLHRFVYSRDPNESGIPSWAFKFMTPKIKGYTHGQGKVKFIETEI